MNDYTFYAEEKYFFNFEFHMRSNRQFDLIISDMLQMKTILG